MASIATSTNASPWAYPANTLMDMQHGARLFALVKTSTANTYQMFFSDTPWTAAWTAYTSTVRANIVDSGSIFITNNEWLYWAYRTNESSQDRIYIRRLSLFSGVWDAETLVDAVANGGVAGAIFGGIDLVVAGTATLAYPVMAIGFTSGAQVGVTLRGMMYSASGTPTVTQSMFSGTKQWLYTGSGRIGPSMDMEHVGDAKVSNAPHLWLCFGRDRLLLVKLAWKGDGWTGPVSANELIPTGMVAHDYTTGRWDGGAFLMGAINPADTTTVLLIERNRANTSTISRTSPPHTTGVVRHIGISYDEVTRNIRVYAIGTSTTVLYYIDYVRATGLWTTWATVLATAVLGSTGQEWGVRRSSHGDSRYDVYTAHSTNALVNTQQAISYSPFTPTWVNTTGQAADVAATLLLDWNFSDADTGDVQSAFAISRQIGAGALAYFRASDSTWQPAEVQNASATSARTLAAAWGAGTDLPHTYRVKVWDSANLPSAYSDALVVIASALVNPAFVTPTPSQVLTGNSVSLTWTAGEEIAYRVRLSITAGAQLYDSGWIAGGALAFTVPYVLLNGGAYTITLQTQNNEGLPSFIGVSQTRDVTVSFLAPDTPTSVNTAVPASGYITVAITNPAPTGGRPAVAYNDVWRRVVGDTSDGVRVGANIAGSGSYNDWQAVSGVVYEYRIFAAGVNGTSIYGAWTA